ncbi:hypothetical protein P153DRAFT_294300 [Dothidotthia symphoricarpi CBS 119687]|uniref:DRBM domain-containing protein n=1 Tax=Dothidotthia symphoricarpi CBS 119687 TaxID=1392245 RepID=A0A6A6AAE3_9PLEO|nr:uncharacterized protein P153DRAFT_294300 [Dothidotthia symphoricarpi CBS 119687]KAF2128125.1 hypothetical protein P153DRAFT_294300 [Dothidotthia symphoricarpi CBS 119687]
MSGQLNDVFSIEDYMRANEAEHVARLAARETNKQMPPTKKPKTSENNTPLQPVAVGARSSDHMVALHDKFQKLGIPQPIFTFAGRSDLGWTVEVSFPGMDVAELQNGLKEEGMFNSKPEAKEAISKSALELILALENEGKVTKPEKAKKGKAGVTASVSQLGEGQKVEQGPNYVGQLLEFQRARSAPQPTYTDYAVGTRFACLLSLSSHADEFGSLESTHSTKKAARQEAARHAVDHFKAQGLWPESFTDVGGIKKKKAQSTTPQIIPSKTPSSSSPANDNKTSGPIPLSTTTSGQTSYAQRVAQLAADLSLPTPEWIYTASPNPAHKDFHNVVCVFRHSGQHKGPIGEVRNVFGKKKAKEECARLTLEYLEEVMQQRVDYGMKMMQGIRGAESARDGAVGTALEGEAEAVRKKREVVVDEDEDAFEDAMEEVET